jgi:hypothetical protein
VRVGRFSYKGKTKMIDLGKEFIGGIIWAVLTAIGFVIKDAVRDAEMRKDIASNNVAIVALKKEFDDMPCASEIICLERRKACNDAFRRELDAGAAQFKELKELIKEANELQHRNYSRLIDLLMEIRKNE